MCSACLPIASNGHISSAMVQGSKIDNIYGLRPAKEPFCGPGVGVVCIELEVVALKDGFVLHEDAEEDAMLQNLSCISLHSSVPVQKQRVLWTKVKSDVLGVAPDLRLASAER